MKHLRKIFENSESIERYVEDCFLDVTENSNFEINTEIHIPDAYERTLTHNPDLIYILNISFGVTSSFARHHLTFLLKSGSIIPDILNLQFVLSISTTIYLAPSS